MAKLASCEAEVVTPEEFETYRCRAATFSLSIALSTLSQVRFGIFKVEEILVNLASSDAAKGEPGGKLRTKIQAHGAVSSIFVGGHAATPYQMPDTVVAGGLTSVKRMGGFGVRWHFGRVYKTEA